MTTLTIPVRDPDTVYIDNWLWVPKKRVSPRILRHSLHLETSEKGVYLDLWRESKHHIGIPRGKMQPTEFGCDAVDLRPHTYPQVGLESLITLDFLDPDSTVQRDAHEDLLLAGGEGILNMGCGSGKTVILLHAAAQKGGPVLVINDKANILLQWKEEVLGNDTELPKLRVDGDIGWIQGNPKKWKWRGCPITFASLKTLSLYPEAVTPEMAAYFQTIIWDEVHHLAASWYAQTADLFLGDRIGASATINRPDGMELVYLWHIGPVFYQNLEQDMIPNVFFRASPTHIDLQSDEVRNHIETSLHDVHHKRICAYVGQRPEEIKFAQSVIDYEVQAGRDILVLAVSKDHSRQLHTLYPESGVLDADVAESKRLAVLRENTLTFATVDMAREALNKKSLDSLIILTEFSSSNNLQQAIGRIQRFCAGKETPRVVVIHHTKIPPMKSMGEKLIGHLKKRGIGVTHVT